MSKLLWLATVLASLFSGTLLLNGLLDSETVMQQMANFLGALAVILIPAVLAHAWTEMTK